MSRLLNINSYHYRRGGADVVYFEHDALFRAQGWDTAFFAMHHPLNEATPWSAHFVDELQYGHRYGPLDKVRMAGKVIYSFEARARLARLLDEFRPDVAHCHNLYHHISPSVLPLLRERSVPTVLTAHDLKLACPAKSMLNRHGVCERCKGGNLLHAVANLCIKDSLAVSALAALESAVHRLLGTYRCNLDRIVVPSRFYQRKLIEWGWAESQITYVPNFVHLERFAPDYRPGDYVIYFGRLGYEKGLPTLLAAAAAADIPLMIVGGGELDLRVRAAAARNPRIVFDGPKSGQALHNAVRGARAAVLASEWYENAPLSVLEAYSLGKPVLGARIGGIPELIEDETSGLLFDSGDVASLGTALQRVMAAPDSKVEQMGRAGRAMVERDFIAERYQRDMMRLYEEIGVPCRQARSGIRSY